MAGEDRLHITSVRFRVLGSGDLLMTLASYSGTRTYTMMPLTMSTATDIEPTRLANFRSQRIRLELSVLEEGEYFKIARIVIFAKASATDHPH